MTAPHGLADAAERVPEALHDSDERYRFLAENLPVQIWTALPDGKLDYVTDQTARHFGLTAPRLLADGWQNVVHPDDLPLAVERWIHSMRTGETYEVEFRLRLATGVYAWHLARAVAHRTAAGTIVGWLGTNTNIEEQREHRRRTQALLDEVAAQADQLRHQNRLLALELEERERLLEITEDARRKAESASRTKDEFLATASHELRTPLNAILGWARILRGGAIDTAGWVRGLETIERNAKAQVQLIDDILDGSRIITGKLHLEIRSVDLAEVLRSALDAVRPAAVAKNIALGATVDAAAGRMRGDPERLAQVVWNLVTNAIKFTPKGGKVDVTLERKETSILLWVRDTGQGIRRDFLPHVFERFRQPDATATRRHGGLGLGLALVRHLVEAHGGTVGVESEGEGRGATFTVTLPAAHAFPEAIEPSLPAVGADAVRGSMPPNSLDGIRVLVIDDEVGDAALR
jgi:PAS domain S-box-containing protein